MHYMVWVSGDHPLHGMNVGRPCITGDHTFTWYECEETIHYIEGVDYLSPSSRYRWQTDEWWMSLIIKIWRYSAVVYNAYFTPVPPQQTPDVVQMLVWCWASVVDGGPTVSDLWFNVSCLLAHEQNEIISRPMARIVSGWRKFWYTFVCVHFAIYYMTYKTDVWMFFFIAITADKVGR